MGILITIMDDNDDIVFEIDSAYQINKFFGEIIKERHKEFDNSIAYCIKDEDIKKLRKLCIEVLEFKRKAKVLLPCGHFTGFIGRNEFNETYFWQLEEFVKFADEILETEDEFFEIGLWYIVSW